MLLAAAGDGPVAEWEVQGGQLKQDRDDVLVVDSSGKPHLRVTAPRAYGAGGEPARAWLRVEGNVVALYTTARGRALVDPEWTTTGSMATARATHTATLLLSGKVLVAGGGTNSAELYDPTSGTWSATGSMANYRAYFTATLLLSGKVLVAGEGTAEVYDPTSGTWTATGSMATALYWHAATLLASGKVLVTGGFLDDGSDNPPPQPTAELYDPGAGTWSATGAMASAHAAHTATLLASGQVLVAGGFFNSIAELYDPTAGTWSATGSMATVRGGHTATLLPSGKVMVAGGFGVSNGSAEPTASAEVYDPGLGTWSATGSMATVRAEHTATLLPSGEVLVAGGYSEDAGPVASTELYAVAGVWCSAGSMQTTRQLHTATLLASGRVLVAGGLGLDIWDYGDDASLTSAELFSVSATSLAIAPLCVGLAPGATQIFTGSGGSGTGYSWALVTNNSGGAITAAGVYTAGATGGVSDVVQVTDSASNTATATVMVSMPLEVSPAKLTLATGMFQAFTASGGSGAGYAWALATNASGGAITAAGVYTAGATGGRTDVVGVTDSASNTATATVTVTATASSTPPNSNGGCGATGAGAVPLLALLVLPLLYSRRRGVTASRSTS